MLYLLTRIGVAVFGLVLGLVIGWAGIGAIISALALDDGRAVDFVLAPIIIMCIIAGGVIGLLAGILFPVFWKDYKMAHQVLQSSDSSTTAQD